MELLKNKILNEGIILNEDILKVDSFLNHQVDCNLMLEIGKEFATHFESKKITKIFTIESSGIAPAAFTALELKVPLVILKKQMSSILNNDFYQTEVRSFTKNNTYNLTLAKKYISPRDNILIIDDFLATGEAAKGTIKIIENAGANVSGIGIVIEKSFQTGRKELDNQGYQVFSLARIKKMNKNKIEFYE